MRQTTETFMEITAKFRQRALLVPQYVADEEMKKTQNHHMLSVYIRDFVSYSTCQTLKDMISKAREQEINLEHIIKRKAM